jgi:hypothetical protein
VQEKATFYIAQWSKGDPEVLEASVAIIHNAASSILTHLEAPSADDVDDGEDRSVAGAA